MTEQAKIKEVAIQLTNVAITNYNDKSISGEQRKKNVCMFLAGLTNTIPTVAWIPDELIANIMLVGIDNLQDFYNDDIEPFVEKCFSRIKHLLKRN